MLLLQLEHQVQDPEADRHVQHRDRLVGEDDRRLGRQCPRDRDPLLLAPGELVRVLGRELLGRDETDRGEQLEHALVHLVSRGTTSWMCSGLAMWCWTRLAGFSEPNGSWKIICTCER